MRIKYIKRHLFIALLFCMMLGGCSGDANRDETSTEDATETPTFQMPSESVEEATSTSIDDTEEDTEEETEGETEDETAVEVVEIPIETESEEVTESETEPVSDTDHIVVLDPGHGGVWYGAMDGTCLEKDLALTVAFYCRDYLTEHYDNVTVYLTRETDTEFSLDQGDDLEARVRIAADYGAEILVSLHFNTDPTDAANGALVCVSKQPWVKDEAAAVGTSILNQLSALGINNMGLLYKDSEEYFDENGEALDYYAICRYSASVGIPGIIVEHCFMRNEIDKQFYTSDEALMSLATADAIGIAQYLGLTEK